MVKNKRRAKSIVFGILGVLIGILILGFILSFFINYSEVLSSFSKVISQESFSVQTILLKETIPLAGEASSVIKIENGGEEQTFSLYFYNLQGMASINENEFTLVAGEEKDVVVNFKDIINEIDVYVGHLVIETSDFVKEIPVVLGVENQNPSFAIIQEPIPTYEEVYPGGKLGMEIKLFNLKDYDKHNIKLSYFFKNFNGEILIPDEENRVVEDSSSITKIINLPKDIKCEHYVFVTLIDENGSKNIASYFFEITEHKVSYLGNLEYFVIIVLVFVVGMFSLLFYFFKSRDKVLLRLQKQQSDELRNNLIVFKKFKKDLGSVKNLKKRKKKLKKLSREKKKVIRSIKEKQKSQKRELHKLRKSKKKKEMQERLKKWRRQGYQMVELKTEIKSIAKPNINSKLQKLKRQGYNLDFFKK